MKTVEEKARAYNKVREKIAIRFGTKVAEEIFSEFEESEDERIRKALIKYFSEGREYLSIIPYNKKECIAWLEKVQKPAEWDEEDESILQGIWDEILANKHDAKEYEWKTYDKFLDWLKSLKNRYTWKPSDEQMEAVKRASNGSRAIFGNDCLIMELLYNDLKKLKGE